ncbi:MAG: ATP-NAD kinase family protein [Thermoplasmata archaeon]
MKRVGFLVNPIAGMGGRVGLKGTDDVLEEAIAMGAEPVAPGRAVEALQFIREFNTPQEIHWLTCGSPMGETELEAAAFRLDSYEVLYEPGELTVAEDTVRAARTIVEAGAEILLFCGGDGTARDILDSIDARLPILGIPSGVKMHSAVFGVSPEAAAVTLNRFLSGSLSLGEAEVIDLDEARYRMGEWSLQLYGLAVTPQEPNLVQMGKLMVEEVADEAIREEMADYLRELMEEKPETLFVFGPGGTTYGICRHLGLETTLLGIDAVLNGKLVGRDLNEDGLLRLLENRQEARLVISPIGAQGFILGRGNLQLSPEVLRMIGLPNILVVATPSKLRVTPYLRVDSSDRDLDSHLLKKGHLLVIVGYRTMKLHPLQGP